MEGCKEQPERMSKHMDLLAGVDRIMSVKKSLERLRSEITGSNEEKPKLDPSAKVSAEPTLSYVLNGTGSKLVAEAEDMHNIIGNIREQLF